MNSVSIITYSEDLHIGLLSFLERCLPESGRNFEGDGHHQSYKNIEKNFERFWCLKDETGILGAVAIKRLSKYNCELKSLYLDKNYQGKGLGFLLIKEAINYAKDNHYKLMYLDTLRSSSGAISLYEKVGFEITEKYNENDNADVFMKLDLMEALNE